MAEQPETTVTTVTAEEVIETKDRGLFGFMGKKEEVEQPKPHEEVVIAEEFEKVHVSEQEPKAEEKEKKPSLSEKLHRSDSSSSSSSDEEEAGEGGEKKKKKKGLKEKIKEKVSGEKKEEEDTSVPIEKVEAEPEEKKGFLDKIKEKLPGQHKKGAEEHVLPPTEVESTYPQEVEPNASSLQRLFSPARRLGRSNVVPLSRPFSTDSLVEIKPGEIGMVSGIPDEHLRRRVVIFSPARTATQQGSGKVGSWKINFLSTQKWENPLMGWTSTGDPYANVGDAGLSFDSEEAAKAFAEKHGWEYRVKKHQTPLLKVKAYADNFKWKGPPKTGEN